jgi:hypothetical protein
MTAVGGCRYYGYRIDGPEPAGAFEAHAFHPDVVEARSVVALVR